MRGSTYHGAGIVEASQSGARSSYSDSIFAMALSVFISGLTRLVEYRSPSGVQRRTLCLFGQESFFGGGPYFPMARRSMSKNWLIRASFLSGAAPARRKSP